MGAAKPGQTIQGKGTGTVQPTNTLQPGSQIFGGTVTPNTIGPNGLPVGGTMPAGYTSPIPAQGGKFPGNPQQPTTSNIPGYAQPYANALNPQVQQPAMVDPAMVAQIQAAYGQPGQVPAQGGKAPLTPQQQADLAPYIDPVRPLPQVQQPAPLGLNLGDMLYGGGGQQSTGYPQRDLGYGNPPPRPQVMPRPVPQVTTTRAPITTTRAPVRPAPMQPQGIAGISQRLNQMRQRGRR